MTKLQSDHQSSILQSQDGYIKCQSHLSDEKRSNEEEIAKLRIHADTNERAFQQRAEQYLNETNMAYKAANEGLEKASSLLKMEVEKHDQTQTELDQANKRLQAIRSTMTESTRVREESEKQLEQLQREMDEELDRRDMERLECDEHHRNLLTCRESLKEALEQKPASEENLHLVDNLKKANAQLTEIEEQKVGLERQVELLTDKEHRQDAFIAEIEFRMNDIEEERLMWETKALTMIEKIGHRSQKKVMNEYGPGPHYVRITLAFTTSPENESFLLELAPLNSMPHTIDMFLTMIRDKTYIGGTIILSRSHILVAGPVDAHNRENNLELEERMLLKGYFPNGALLYKEYDRHFPHVKHTLGFNQVGGPVFYVNLQDNAEFHGPSETSEGEPCFAKIVEGVDVIERIMSMPTAADDSLESSVYISDTTVVMNVESDTD